MTHREYTLTVETPIYESIGETKAIYKNVGETLTVSQENFLKLQKGEDIAFAKVAGHGMYSSVIYDKSNFANEVTYTEVTVSYGTAKLGKRKPK